MRFTYFIFFTFFISHLVIAQRNCATDLYAQQLLLKNPELESRILQDTNFENNQMELDALKDIIVIPVVVHVVYKTPEENLSDVIINDQIKILNNDFSGLNSDISNTPFSFKNLVAGDCGIQFKLYAITRTQTKVNVFSYYNDYIKLSQFGGQDVGQYPTNKFLNIWVGNIQKDKPDDLLGYATFPREATFNMDGVVIHYKAFGITNMTVHFNQGRTATHEIGHWLGLQHLWGGADPNDADCGDDGISDTPIQQYSNEGCPTFPQFSCGNEPKGDMYMNYMDYVDDQCMCMFSSKQKDRMRANFLANGARVDIIRGNDVNREILLADTLRNDENAPLFTNIMNDSIAWTKINNATKYTLKLKPLGEDTVYILTTEDENAYISGLQDDKIYEFTISVQLNDDQVITGNSIIFELNKEKESILLKEY